MTHFHSARLADGRRGIWLGHAHGWFPVRLMWRMLRRGGGPRKAGGARGLPASSDFAGQDARRRRAQRAATVATGRISSRNPAGSFFSRLGRSRTKFSRLWNFFVISQCQPPPFSFSITTQSLENPAASTAEALGGHDQTMSS